MVGDIAALLNAIAWPLVVGCGVFYFRNELEATSQALRSRISSGSRMKIGEFELDRIEPQTSEEILEIKKKEVADLTEDQPSEKLNPPERQAKDLASDSMVLQLKLTEENVLTKLQNVFGVSINRQIKISGTAFDGSFIKDGTLHLVEISYINRPTILNKLIQNLSDLIISSEFRIRSLSWRNYKYVIVLVVDLGDFVDFSSDNILETFSRRLFRKIGDAGPKVQVLTFSMKEISSYTGEVLGE